MATDEQKKMMPALIFFKTPVWSCGRPRYEQPAWCSSSTKSLLKQLLPNPPLKMPKTSFHREAIWEWNWSFPVHQTAVCISFASCIFDKWACCCGSDAINVSETFLSHASLKTWHRATPIGLLENCNLVIGKLYYSHVIVLWYKEWSLLWFNDLLLKR